MQQQSLPLEPAAAIPPKSSPDVRSVRLPPSPKASEDHRSLGGGGQPDFVRHHRARRYVVRVRADGTVRVTIPRWGTKREAAAFVEQQRGWIAKQLARLQVDDSRPRPQLSEEATKAFRSRAKLELPQRLLQLAKQFGLRVSRVSIRNQQSRWGSCSPNGHICLNWRLVTMPEWVRDYVIIHELMHLKRLDHSPKFWKLVAAACPDYQRARDWLRTCPHV
ncbi:MAG TPA: M48 family metallopeptidase [Vicinamibacterales bacterium]